MDEMTKHGELGHAAMKADMDRKTARKYVAAGKVPSELRPTGREWRTRVDPFAEHWPDVVDLVEATPELEAKTIFELLVEQHPGRYEPGQVRTLQRKLRRWKATSGPAKDVTLGQMHRPGEAAQTDFTSTSELAVTIAGQVFVHLLCVLVLPFSNWLWATVCLSESMAALRKGVQRALFQLGRVPQYHQTDNSTAATHKIPEGEAVVVPGRKRPFNDAYVALMAHFGMTPRTIEVGAKEQNGDVESANGAIKRRLEQALLVRGSRDFDNVEAWQVFIDGVARKANVVRGTRVAEELGAMRELAVGKLPEFVDDLARVSEWSTIRLKDCAYSVPSRLIGEVLKVRLYEDRLEAYFGGELQLSCERLVGRKQKRIDYRHVIWSLVRKPGGFARYVYREEMFPTLAFRRAYDAISAPQPGTKADLEYLRILHLAASTLQTDVEAALVVLLDGGHEVTADAVKALVVVTAAPAVPHMVASLVDLGAYDALLSQGVAA